MRRRLVADVPLGALLSGGIDSAIVVSQMAQAAAGPVRTFTVGFADERYDERTYARAVAERWSTQHEEVVLEPDAAATLPRLAAAFDEPLGDEAALPLFLICEAARRDVTVALVGD
ncbi:MAG: asparagine synthase C-terminal domain-containing protein, partial [Actinomycetota bacterium]